MCLQSTSSLDHQEACILSHPPSNYILCMMIYIHNWPRSSQRICFSMAHVFKTTNWSGRLDAYTTQNTFPLCVNKKSMWNATQLFKEHYSNMDNCCWHEVAALCLSPCLVWDAKPQNLFLFLTHKSKKLHQGLGLASDWRLELGTCKVPHQVC